ncbi:MAG: hypothetical protein EBV86_14115, partial [Marivivens sp.]|nr:hypothetical protein [Marivivens sp.]
MLIYIVGQFAFEPIAFSFLFANLRTLALGGRLCRSNDFWVASFLIRSPCRVWSMSLNQLHDEADILLHQIPEVQDEQGFVLVCQCNNRCR